MLKAIGIPTIAFSKVFLHNIPPVPTSYCSCMLARCISPFEGGRGDVSSQASHLSLHHIVRVCLSVASPPLKGAGGMLLPSLPPVPTSYCSCMLVRHISPFEGGRGDVSSQASHLSLHRIVRVCLPVTSPPLKEVRELAQRSMC